MKTIPMEAVIWVTALVLLAFLSPDAKSDFTLCPLNTIGITDCPGCGLGRSVSFALQGDPFRSFQKHPLGIPAITILIFRIFSLIRGQNKTRTLYFSPQQRRFYG